jgi:NRAMP (natural resistance-associated macrophage protein)-like metal ion transporter
MSMVAAAKPVLRPTPWWKTLSAGIVTGAADDDPSGIATYSQVGAAYNYATLWSVMLALPLMIGIQLTSARIGRVTGKGLARNFRARYGRWIAYALAAPLFIANTINLGADVGAMGASVKLLIGGPALAYTSGFVLLSVVLQVFVQFEDYSPYLKALTLSLFVYVATVFVVHVPWLEVLHATFIPHIHPDAKYAVAIVAVLGTTISPYLFFWQANQEVEELRDPKNDRKKLTHHGRKSREAFQRIGIDTVVGMAFSEAVAFCIIITAASVLHAHGKTDIVSAAEAAAALKPLAGKFASALFAIGIIGTGLLAVPVLAGSAAYGVAEAFNERADQQRPPLEARFFYAIIALSAGCGLALNFTSIDPIKALYWSAVINGVAAVPIMIAVMLLANDRRCMKHFRLPWWLNVLGGTATLVMAAAAVIMFATWGK